MSLVARMGGQRGGLSARFAQIQDALAFVAPDWKTVPFGPWLPDLPDYMNPGATVANNVIPLQQSYGSLGQLNAVSSALDARARGAIVARDSSGNNYNYAGNASKLYEVRSTGLTDKSKSGGYATADDDVWEFTLFGTTLVATNLTNPVQSITIGSASAFADLITSTLTPKARHCATIREFLFLGHTNDATDGLVPHRAWWSAYRDATDFDPDADTQCDYEDRLSAGWVQRIVGGTEYGLLFQQRAITRISYAGAPAIFQFDEIDRQRGTPAPNSVIGHGRLVFFLSDEGLYANDGTQSYPIGEGQVDKTFLNQFDINDAHLMSAAIDPVNKLVAWAFPGKIYFYNWASRKWSDADVSVDALVNSTSEAYTLEDLDAVFLDSTADTTLDANEASGQTILSVADETLFEAGDTVRITLNSGGIDQTTVASIGTGTITVDDALTGAADSGNRVVRTSIDAPGYPSLDSPQWKGGGLLFGAFDTAHKLAYFDGDNLEATLETGEADLNPGFLTKAESFRPLVDGGTLNVAIAGRNTLQDAVSFGSSVGLNAIGEANILDEHRYQRARVGITAGSDWAHAQGIQVLASRAGSR